MKMKIYHNPPHRYLDNTDYFLTASIYKKRKLIDTDRKKQILMSNLREIFEEFKYKIIAWVILDNHYHLMFKSKKGEELKNVIKRFHGCSSFRINKSDNTVGRKVWYQYWDKCIRSENDNYKYLNYIHHNPIKHKVENKMEKYCFSSYKAYLRRYGEQWLDDCFSRYPISDFTEVKDDFDGIKVPIPQGIGIGTSVP